MNIRFCERRKTDTDSLLAVDEEDAQLIIGLLNSKGIEVHKSTPSSPVVVLHVGASHEAIREALPDSDS